MDISLLPIIGLAVVLVLSPSTHKEKSKKGYSKRSSKSTYTRPVAKSSKKPKTAESISLGRKFSSQKEYKAILEYITTRYKSVNRQDAEKIAKYLVQYGKENNVDPKFAAAVIARESAFNKKAISSTGAKGLGQIKDFNYKSLNIKDPYDIKQNVSGTVGYLKRMVGKWQGSSEASSLTLASYYEGPNSVKSKGGKYDGNTKKYVNDILKKYEEIKDVRKKYR